MKKMLCVLLALLLCPMLALAEESVAEPLSYQELVSWAEGYLARAKESTPLNDPANSLTPDGYDFVYDFATLYADTPDMSNDTALNAVVLTIDMENGPRSVNVDNAMSVVLDAYYNENAMLEGTKEACGRKCGPKSESLSPSQTWDQISNRKE